MHEKNVSDLSDLISHALGRKLAPLENSAKNHWANKIEVKRGRTVVIFNNKKKDT